MREMIWKTARGEMIRVCDMETRHIENCIRKIMRDNWRRRYLNRMQLEITIRSMGLTSRRAAR